MSNNNRCLQFELWYECNSKCKYCVPGDTLIKMSDFTDKQIKDIKVGDVVLTYDRSTKKYIKAKVLATNCRYIEEPIYKINTKDTELLITKDHKIAIQRGRWLEPKYIYTAKEQFVYSSKMPACLGKRRRIEKSPRALMTRKQISNIEPINFSGYVYNIQTEAETYIANDILVHNCYLCDDVLKTSDTIKLRNLQAVIDKISDLSIYKDYDKLSYLGGEFFQGQLNTPEVKAKFMELMDKTSWLLDNGYIKCVWLYATMTIGDQKDLYDTLAKFNIKKDNFWLLTSYDTIGRFHSPKMEETWKYHMKHVKELYPDILINTTTIITGDLIDKYFNGEFSFKYLLKNYTDSFFLKYPWLPANFKSKADFNTYLPNFFPTRKQFLEFFRKFKQEESDDMWNKLFDFGYRAAVCMKNGNGEEDDKFMVPNVRDADTYSETEGGESSPLKCGHVDSGACYVDSDRCVICDKLMIDNI